MRASSACAQHAHRLRISRADVPAFLSCLFHSLSLTFERVHIAPMLIRKLLPTVLLLCLPLYAELEKAQSSAADFVQSFYGWYVPFARADHSRAAFELALKRDSSIFSVELAKALRADAAAQAKVSGEINGLDCDPFLNSQDPDERYELGKVTQKDGRHLCPLHGVSEGKKRPRPVVIAEVEQKSGHWIFVNFHSPEGGDVLSLLKALSTGRRKNP